MTEVHVAPTLTTGYVLTDIPQQTNDILHLQVTDTDLNHHPLDNMAAISQTAFSNAFF